MRYPDCYPDCGGEDCVCCNIYLDHQSELNEPESYPGGYQLRYGEYGRDIDFELEDDPEDEEDEDE